MVCIDLGLTRQIIRNVRHGIRDKSDLRRCGCPECELALKIMAKEG